MEPQSQQQQQQQQERSMFSSICSGWGLRAKLCFLLIAIYTVALALYHYVLLVGPDRVLLSGLWYRDYMRSIEGDAARASLLDEIKLSKMSARILFVDCKSGKQQMVCPRTRRDISYATVRIDDDDAMNFNLLKVIHDEYVAYSTPREKFVVTFPNGYFVRNYSEPTRTFEAAPRSWALIALALTGVNLNIMGADHTKWGQYTTVQSCGAFPAWFRFVGDNNDAATWTHSNNDKEHNVRIPFSSLASWNYRSPKRLWRWRDGSLHDVLVITRFSVNTHGAGFNSAAARNINAVYDPQRLQEKMMAFSNWVYPSLLNQTFPHWTWCIHVSESLPSVWFWKLVHLLQDDDRVYIVLHRDVTCN